MKLVVDTNILFSFFRDNPVRKMIIESPLFNLDLFTPEYAFNELTNIKGDIIKYANISNNDFIFLFGILNGLVNAQSLVDFEDYKDEAKKISPDLKDAPFFALALKLGVGIWSNESRLKNQDRVKVFSTRDLMVLFNLI